MKNQAFKCEGLELRYREKPIYETNEYSRSLDEKINPQANPRIFLHSDGQLYFSDNTLPNPIPLSKLKVPYDRIKVEDGELRFYKPDYSGYVTLSDINKKKVSLQKNNAMLYTESKTVPNRSEINILDQVKKAYYLSTGNTADTSSYQSFYDDIATNGSTIIDAFISDFTTNFSMRSRSDEDYYTPQEFLVNKFIRGITARIVVGTGIYSSQNYYIFQDANNKQIQGFPTSLNNMEIFFNKKKFGFTRTEYDAVNTTKEFFAGRPFSDFSDWFARWLYETDGIYAYLYNIFGAKRVGSGKAYTADMDNGYTTTTNQANRLATETQINAEGYFYDTVYYPLQDKIIKSIAKGISHCIHEKLVTILEDYFANTLNILYQNGNEYYFNDTINDKLIDYSTVLDAIQDRLTDSLSSDLGTSIETSIRNAMSPNTNSYILAFSPNETIYYGGHTSISASIDIDYKSMSQQWFDIENFDIVTQPIDNSKGIAINAHFNVTVSDSHYQSTLEFRLIETSIGEVLDTCYIKNIKEDASYMIGDANRNKGCTTIYPIALCYYGPVPQFACTTILNNNTIDDRNGLWTHPTIVSATSNCAPGICINEEGNILKELSENIMYSSDAQVIKNTEIPTLMPRIFRVQWRLVPNTEMSMPQNDDINVFTINSATNLDEYRINASIYNMTLANNQRKIKQNIEQFVNQNRKQVMFLFPMSSTDYSISLIANQNVKVWYENKTETGFVIAAEREITGEVSWVIAVQPIVPVDISDTKNIVCCVDNASDVGTKSNFDILKREQYYTFACQQQGDVIIQEPE